MWLFVSFLIFLKSSDGEFPRSRHRSICDTQYRAASNLLSRLCFPACARHCRAVHPVERPQCGPFAQSFPSVSVTCVVQEENLLQPSNSHLPPALTKRIKRESGVIFRAVTTGEEAAGCLLGGFLICLVLVGPSSSEAFFRTPRTTPATLNSVLITIGWWAGLLDWGFRTT